MPESNPRVKGKSSTTFCVSVDFFTHFKTRKLRKRLGPQGILCLFHLWAYASSFQTDGNLSYMTPEDIELAADWEGKEGLFCATIRKIGFLNDDFSLHDWQEHNPWLAGAQKRSDKARKASQAKWRKVRAMSEEIQ
jgi:hypothetical protein